ncbi:MAG: hypothetical protein CSA07_03660 [Bacteroidia bacterium]|nr:MAG: hypothetical protein CSA07_03660 [Bacteroidia bacterium]
MVKLRYKTIARRVMALLMLVSVLIGLYFAVQLSGSQGQMDMVGAAEPMLVWTYVLLAVASVVALAFPLYFVVRNPRRAVRAVVFVGLLVFVLGVSYLVASDAPIARPSGMMDSAFADPLTLKMVGAGLIATYTLLAVALVLLLLSGVRMRHGIRKGMA